MKANFIIPSWSYWNEPLRAQPLTQMYLATLLEEKGVDVEFTDMRNRPDYLKPNIIKEADMYLYTVASPDFQEVDKIRTGIKEHYPKSKHIAGGPHASIMPQDFEDFDSVVIGRGEETLKAIVNDFPDVKSLYRLKAKDKYSFPNRKFLPPNKIVNSNLFKTDNLKSTTAQFSFGCPFSCSFCANYNKDSIRRNPLDKVSDEIDYLKLEYGIQGLSLQDEICLPKKADSFLEMLASKDIKWRGQVRANINAETIMHAKESGLVELSFGLESVDQNVLDFANKKIKVEDVERTIDYCKNNDIKTRIYLLNGLPREPEDIIQKTIQFVKRTSPDVVLLSTLQPYPGSPIYNNPEKYGMKWISKDYEKMSHIRDADHHIDKLVPFEYENGFSRERIVDNLKSLESYLEGRGLRNK